MNIQRFKLVALMFLMTVFLTEVGNACQKVRDNPGLYNYMIDNNLWDPASQGFAEMRLIAVSKKDKWGGDTDTFWQMRSLNEDSHFWIYTIWNKDCEPQGSSVVHIHSRSEAMRFKRQKKLVDVN